MSPKPLPGGRHFLFFARSGNPKIQGLYVGSVDGAPAKLISNEPSTAEYSAVGGGHLLFVKEGMLMAQPFDAKTFRLYGEPVPITEGVSAPGARANMSVSQAALLYSNGGQVSGQLATYGRDGNILAAHEPAAMYNIGSLSPGGDWAAMAVRQFNSNMQLRIIDLSRGISTLIDESNNSRPLISPDGSQLAYTRGRVLTLRSPSNPSQKPVEWELPAVLNGGVVLDDWARTVSALLLSNGGDLWLLEPVPGGKLKRLTETQGVESSATFSPNGKWIAYSYREATESRNRNIVLQEFDSTAMTLGKRYVISSEEQRLFASTFWKGDSTECYYLSTNGELKAATIDAARTFPSKTLAKIADNAVRLIGVSSDGSRFLVLRQSQSSQQALTLILNWSGLLKPR